MDQLQGMRVFTRVAELGSFVRAANTLDLSRAMASSYVAQLEKHLGTRLLHRTTRKVSVSPQGAVYLEHCKRILAEIDSADDQLRLARNRPPHSIIQILIPGAGHRDARRKRRNARRIQSMRRLARHHERSRRGAPALRVAWRRVPEHVSDSHGRW